MTKPKLLGTRDGSVAGVISKSGCLFYERLIFLLSIQGDIKVKNIIKGLRITIFVLICQFFWLLPSSAGDFPWPLFLAAINAEKNDTIPGPPDNRPPPGTVTSAGQIWMDRNLGASRIAISYDDSEAFGGLYQWGRGRDGHEKRNSPLSFVHSITDTPGHGSFIVGDATSLFDWRVSQNDELWQGVSGINNPCPPGFRLPTNIELDTERLSWSSNDRDGAFDSPLKLVAAGGRNLNDGTLFRDGSVGYYWSSGGVDGFYSLFLAFNSDRAVMSKYLRASGSSVRCLKD